MSLVAYQDPRYRLARMAYLAYRRNPSYYNRAAMQAMGYAQRTIASAYRRYRRRNPDIKMEEKPIKLLRRPKPPVARRLALRRRVGQMRTTGKMGVYPDIGKKPNIDPYTVATGNDESVHQIDQDGSVTWFGFQHFKRGQVFDQVATHFMKRILKRMNSTVVSHYTVPECCSTILDTSFSSPRLARIVLHFRAPQYIEADRAELPPSTDQVLGPSQLHDLQFYVICQFFANCLRERAKIGYKLYRIDVYKSDKVDASLLATPLNQFAFKLDNLDKAKVNFSVRCNIKVQNVTPSDTDNMNLNAVDANPLKGMIYDFDAPTPRLQRQYLDDQTTYRDAFSSIQATDSEDGLIDFKGIREPPPQPNDPAGALVQQWRQPIKQTRGIFQQLRGQQECLIKPGGYTSIPRVFNYNGRLGDFLIGLLGSMNGTFPSGSLTAPVYATTGSCTVLCLQHLMRDTALNAGEDVTHVKLAINVRYDYTFSYTDAKDRPMPRRLYHE